MAEYIEAVDRLLAKLPRSRDKETTTVSFPMEMYQKRQNFAPPPRMINQYYLWLVQTKGGTLASVFDENIRK